MSYISWHARARANDLQDGDKNMSFFHHKASERKHYNTISGLTSDGVWRNKKEDLEDLVAPYFGTLFTLESPCDFEQAMAGTDARVTKEMMGDSVSSRRMRN